MAFNVTFYGFEKRINSTKRPTGGTTVAIQEIKAASSAVSPVFGFDFGQSGNPTAFNYAYVPEFHRYYFVSDWTWSGRLWWCSLRCDVLASYKEAIAATSCYVLRSSSSYDGRIIDGFYPTMAQCTQVMNTISGGAPFTDDMSNGSYVIGIQGKSAGDNGGAVTYYAGSESTMRALVNYMLQDAGTLEVDDISEQLLKCIFNPLQYVVSCMYFPFTVTKVNVNAPTFGWWNITGLSLQGLAGYKWGQNYSFTIPKHPKAASRGEYLNMPPFSRYKLEAGPFGVIPLDNFNLIDDTTLSMLLYVDLITGTGRLSIKNRDVLSDSFIATAQIGVPIQLGQNLLNQGALQSMGNNIHGMAASIVEGSVLGAAMTTTGTIMDAASLTQSVPSVLGSNGTLAFNNNWSLTGEFIDVVDDDNAENGRPLCKKVSISTLSGYVQCMNADPSIACTDTELSEVVSFMNSGFFYE